MSLKKIGHFGNKDCSLSLLEETVAKKYGLHTFVCVACKATFFSPYMAGHHVKKKHPGRQFKDYMSVNMDCLNEKGNMMKWEGLYIEVSNNIYENLEKVFTEKLGAEVIIVDPDQSVQKVPAPQVPEDISPATQALKEAPKPCISMKRATNCDTDPCLLKRIKNEMQYLPSSSSTTPASGTVATPSDDSLSVVSDMSDSTAEKSEQSAPSYSILKVKTEPKDTFEDRVSQTVPTASVPRPSVLNTTTRPVLVPSAPISRCLPSSHAVPVTRPDQNESLWDEVYEETGWRNHIPMFANHVNGSTPSTSAIPQFSVNPSSSANAERSAECPTAIPSLPDKPRHFDARAIMDKLLNIKREIFEANEGQHSTSAVAVHHPPVSQERCPTAATNSRKESATEEYHKQQTFRETGEEKLDPIMIPTVPERGNMIDPRKDPLNFSHIYGKYRPLDVGLEPIACLVEEVRKMNEEAAKKKVVHDRKMQNLYSCARKNMLKKREAEITESCTVSNSEPNISTSTAHVPTLVVEEQPSSSGADYDAYYARPGAKYPPFHLVFDQSTLYDADQNPTAELMELCNQYASLAYYCYSNDWHLAYDAWMDAFNSQNKKNTPVDIDHPYAEASTSEERDSRNGSGSSSPMYGPEDNCSRVLS